MKTEFKTLQDQTPNQLVTPGYSLNFPQPESKTHRFFRATKL